MSGITFITVKWGSKYGPEYVNILEDMLRRNLPPGAAAQFLCFTDNPAGLNPGIETRPLPLGLTGWWNKLYLFKAGLFPQGQRLFFLDLDTAIAGNIGDIISYAGEFAILRDFYNPRGYNSSLMLWRAGFGSAIWDSYEAAGRPEIEGGDQVWIDRCVPQADILQDLFPGAIVSFKQKALLELPAGVRIVCFHGLPRPHEVRNGWVENVWKIGGQAPTAGGSGESPIENARHALALALPSMDTITPPHPQRGVCLVGAGASAENFAEDLRQKQQQGFAIWAVSSAVRRLEKLGIRADTHVMSEPGRGYSAFVPERPDTVLLYASQCHPEVFSKALSSPRQVILWHPRIDGIRELLGGHATLFIGGNTTGMRAVALAYAAGFGHIHLYGFDSSFAANENESAPRMTIDMEGRKFETSERLAQQVNEFSLLVQSLTREGITLALHGDGLLPYAMRRFSARG